MERTYAGILGLVALITAILRGWYEGAAADTTLRTAWLDLLVFTCIGYVVARLAGWIVDDAVRSRVAAEMAEYEARNNEKTTK